MYGLRIGQVRAEMAPADAVVLVVEYLRAQEHLAGVEVTAERPPGAEVPPPQRLPYLLVESLGDAESSRLPWARTRRTRIGLQVWVDGRADDAVRVLRGALAALYAARSVRLPGGATIDRVEAGSEATELSNIRGPDGIHRALTTINVTVR